MSMNKSSKMLAYINWRMRVTIGQDGRQLVGTFLAFDRHMNLVLADCEEFRVVKKKKGSKMVEEKEEKRTLGLVLLRGENVVSVQVEAPPQQEAKPKLTPGPGQAVAAGRGMPLPAQVAAQAAPIMGGRGMVPPGGMPPPGMMPPGGMMPPPGGMMPPPGGMMPPPGGMMHPQGGMMPPPGGMMPPQGGMGRGGFPPQR